MDKQNYFTYIDNTSDDTKNLYKQTIIDGADVSGDKFVLNCCCEKLRRKEQECEMLKEKLQKYIDKEQREIELNKKRADSFKEMQKR